MAHRMHLKTLVALSLVPLVLAAPLFGAEPVQLQKKSNSSASHTEDFRAFLYRFFNNPEFQLERVKFPIQFTESPDSDTHTTKTVDRGSWKHIAGPKHYQCKSNCFDIVIYDNFERKYTNDTKRLFSLEGVDNGINALLYFEAIEGKWYLVMSEDL